MRTRTVTHVIIAIGCQSDVAWLSDRKRQIDAENETSIHRGQFSHGPFVPAHFRDDIDSFTIWYLNQSKAVGKRESHR